MKSKCRNFNLKDGSCRSIHVCYKDYCYKDMFDCVTPSNINHYDWK